MLFGTFCKFPYENPLAIRQQTITFEKLVSHFKNTLMTYKIPNAESNMAMLRGKVKCSPSKHATLKLKANGIVIRGMDKYSEFQEASKPVTTYGNNSNKVWR